MYGRTMTTMAFGMHDSYQNQQLIKEDKISSPGLKGMHFFCFLLILLTDVVAEIDRYSCFGKRKVVSLS
jgi:hypothetical protein